MIRPKKKKKTTQPTTTTDEIIRSARILAYDLETTPLLGWTYATYEASILKIEQPSYILCFSYAWIDPSSDDFEVRVVTLRDFALYRREPTNDREVVKVLHELLSEADYILTFNGDNFDSKVAATAFLRHGLTPNPPTKSIDVLKILRKHFKLNVIAGSNRLGDVAECLLGEGKVHHSGSALWFDVMAGSRRGPSHHG